MSELSEAERQEWLREGYHKHGDVLCDGCDSAVDLSDADDLDGAVAIWNEHVRSEHSEDGDDAE